MNALRTAFVVSGVRSSYTSAGGQYVFTGVRIPHIHRPTHIEIVSNDEHRRITTRALALDLDDGELAVLGRLAGLDAAELGADGVEDVVRAAEHARRRRADLDKVFAYRFAANARKVGRSVTLHLAGRGTGRTFAECELDAVDEGLFWAWDDEVDLQNC